MSQSTRRTILVRGAAAAVAVVTMGAALTPRTVQAQSDSEMAAAIAIWMTPFGRVATVNHAAMGQSGRALGANYSSQSNGEDPRATGYAGLLDWGSLQFQVAATEMSGMNTIWSGSASYGMQLLGAGQGLPFGLGVEVGAAYGRLSEEGEKLNSLVAGARVPLVLSLDLAGMRVAPYAAPGFFFGRLSAEGESEEGTRATANAGVRLMLHNGLAIDVGMQHTFIDEAKSVFGGGLTYSFR